MDSRAHAAPLVLLRKCFSKGGERIYSTNTSSLEVSVSLRRNLLEETDWKRWICVSLDTGQYPLDKFKIYGHACDLFLAFFL